MTIDDHIRELRAARANSFDWTELLRAIKEIQHDASPEGDTVITMSTELASIMTLEIEDLLLRINWMNLCLGGPCFRREGPFLNTSPPFGLADNDA